MPQAEAGDAAAGRPRDEHRPGPFLHGRRHAEGCTDGEECRAKGILVKTGYGVNIIRTDMPAYIAGDILEAVQWILKDRKKE